MFDAVVIAARFALYVGALALAGIAAFAVYAPAAADLLPWRRLMTGLAWLTLIASVAHLFTFTAAMAGSAASAMDPTVLWMVAGGTDAGASILVRLAALALLLIMLATSVRPARATALALSGVALAALACSGHAVTDTGAKAILHLCIDALHLLAAGVWIGVLIAFLFIARRTSLAAGPVLYRALAGFSGIGAAVVAVLTLTGVANVLLILGWSGLAMAWDALWLRLLIVKLALFAGMLGLAWLNRTRLTPRLGADPVAATSWQMLRRSLLIETILAVAIVALVAWLGTLSPMPDM